MNETLLHKTTKNNSAADLLKKQKFVAAFLVYLSTWSLLGQHILKEGFSGKNTDIIYRNEPISPSRIGQLIDRFFLNLPSCRAIRATLDYRLSVLKEYLKKKSGDAINILSVPCGYSRDILTLVQHLSNDLKPRIRIVGIDLDPECIAYSEAAARQQLCNTAQFILGDAYRLEDCLGTATADIILSIGLADFMTDERVRKFYHHLYERINKDGLLVTSSHYPSPRMQRLSKDLGITCYFRNKAQFEGLVTETGFTILSSWTDPGRIVTVSAFSPRK